MPRQRKPPSATWKMFLKNHLPTAAAMDPFVIPSATLRALYGFVVLHHGRRVLLHVNVTEHPTAGWIRQQLREAFPDDTALRFLHRDRDAAFQALDEAIRNFGIEQVVSAPRSPWQNPYVEPVIGAIRRDLLDHVIVLGPENARRLLLEYRRYYNQSRTHLALEKDAPVPRLGQGPDTGKRTVAVPVLGGLHHRHERRAA